jgi:hypothetical protein
VTPRVLWHDAEARGFREGVTRSSYDCRAAEGGLIVGNMSERLRNDTRSPSLCSGISSSKTPSRSSRADAPGKGACARPDPCAGRRPAAPFSRYRSFSIAPVQSPACIAVLRGRARRRPYAVSACSAQYGPRPMTGSSQYLKERVPGSPMGQRQGQSMLSPALYRCLRTESAGATLGVVATGSGYCMVATGGSSGRGGKVEVGTTVRCRRAGAALPLDFLIGEGRAGKSSRCAFPTTAFFEMPMRRPISAVE